MSDIIDYTGEVLKRLTKLIGNRLTVITVEDAVYVVQTDYVEAFNDIESEDNVSYISITEDPDVDRGLLFQAKYTFSSDPVGDTLKVFYDDSDAIVDALVESALVLTE
jgi:hypothetical protein